MVKKSSSKKKHMKKNQKVKNTKKNIKKKSKITTLVVPTNDKDKLFDLELTRSHNFLSSTNSTHTTIYPMKHNTGPRYFLSKKAKTYSTILKLKSLLKNPLLAFLLSPLFLSPPLYHDGLLAYAFLPKLYGISAITSCAFLGMWYFL